MDFVSPLDYDAQGLVGRSVTIPIAKTRRHTLFRECIVQRYYPKEGIWKARCIRTDQEFLFDLEDVFDGRVLIDLE